MRKIATLVGCAIGDALGNPFEMWSTEKIASQNWDGLFKDGGTFWKGKAGQYTDDTLMSRYLAQSIIDNKGFDVEKVAQEYLAWYNTGNTRGIGNTTATAMENLKAGKAHYESGLVSNTAAGNGTAMRATPIGLWYRHDHKRLVDAAWYDAKITHNSEEPKMGSIAVAVATSMLANDWSIEGVLKHIPNIVENSDVKMKLILANEFLNENVSSDLALQHIGVSGYVADTVGAAFYCLGRATSFKETVVMAVKAGGDTDTIAAIAGALAGTYYGLDAIPDEYKNQVEDFQLLQDLTDKLIS